MTGTLLLLAICTGLWWWYDDSDLREVKQRAKGLGLPVTWAETGRVLTTGKRLATWKEMIALRERSSLRSYATSSNPKTLRKAFTPITPALRAWHEKLSPGDMYRLLELIDELGTGLVVLHSSLNMRDSYPEMEQYRNLTDLLRERLLLAPTEQVGEEGRRLLGIISTWETPTMVSAFIRMRTFNEILVTLSERWQDLQQHGQDLIPLITRLTALMSDCVVQGETGQFLQFLDLVEHPPSYSECLGLGVIADGSWDGSPRPWMFRTGRRHLLDTQIDWIVMLRGETPLRTAIQFGMDLEREPYREWRLHRRLARHFMMRPDVSMQALERCRMHAALFVAELQSGPWPIDSFDPLLHPLRRVERDGMLIGAYSVGEDGVDDGGIPRKDAYFPLYGPLEPPTPPATSPAP